MSAASPGTLTDQIAGSSVEDVAVRSVEPTVTVTEASLTEPVSPPIVNPAAFSAMFTVLSVAMALRFSTSVPAVCTVTVYSAVASL